MATELRYLIDGDTEGALIEIKPTVDLIHDVSVSSTTTISTLPLESGRPVNDNAVDDPLRIRLAGSVSDLIVQEGRNPDQPKQTWVLLNDLKQRKVLLTLITELGVYENLLIQSLGNGENVRTGKSLQFTMNLQQVNFIDAEFTDLTTETVTTDGPAVNRTSQVNKGVLNATAT